MNEFEAILDDCLRLMRTDGYSVDQCLARYPEQAAQLRPLLDSAERLSRGRDVSPSAAFRAATRARLIAHAEARRPRMSVMRMSVMVRPAWQFAMAMAVLALVMLASTTAVAQNAFPGEPLYGWKLGSENVWRTVATDRLEVDLRLADRRTTELTKVAGSSPFEEEAREEYHEVLSRLEAEIDSENGAKIDQALLAHQQKLANAGIKDDKLDSLVKGKKK